MARGKVTWNTHNTVGATFHLMGRLEIPKAATLVLDPNGEATGFMLPNGKTYKVQVVLEQESADGEHHKDMGSTELEALGIYGFGELDVRDFRTTEED